MPLGTFTALVGDGDLAGTAATFSGARDKTTADITEGAGTASRVRLAKTASDYTFYRGYIPFNTSSIGVGFKVDSGTISLYGLSSIDGGGSVAIVNSTQADGGTLVAGDYDGTTDVVASDYITIASYNTAGYNNFPMNGNAVYNLEGTTFFSVRDANDIANNDPSVGTNDVRFQANEHASNLPTLVINYSVSGQYLDLTSKMW